MKNQNKITEGNAFALNIRQAVWRTLGGVIQPLLASELVDVHLYVGSGTSKSTATEYNVTADGDTISAVMPATLKRGVYRTWMTALYQGREVASACECAFEIVAFDEHGIYAPERIDGQPCVYLQGASMTDPEIEQYKARLLELQQQREQEVQALEAERKRVAEVAAQMEDVATEKTQQLMVKQITTIAESTDISGLMNIKAAIELKGGQDVYSNPELPKLTELARNVGTIPQEFMSLEPEGVRYDDPVEWHAFREEVARAVSAARALQDRIYAEGGIPSIQNANVRYKGFILIDITKLLTWDTDKQKDYINLSFLKADAFLIGCNSSEKTLIEKSDFDEVKYYINIASFRDNQDIFIAYLYKDDNFSAKLDFSRKFISTIVIGGHSSRIEIQNASIGNMYQLNVTDNTYIRIWDGDVKVNYLYTRRKSGYAQTYTRYVFEEQLEYLSDFITYQDCISMYAPNLYSMSKIDNGVVTASYNITGPNHLYAPNMVYGGPLSGSLFIDLPIRYVYAGVIGYSSTSSISLPNLEEMIGGYTDIYEATSISNSNRLNYLNAPNLRKLTFPGYGALLRSCMLLERLELPSLAYFQTKWQLLIAEKCDILTEIILPRLQYCVCLGHGGRENLKACPKMKKLVVGNVNSNEIWGCIGANDFIHFEFAETLDYTIRMENWLPTNALNDSISTLVDEGEEFSNNREKFLWNFRNYIIAMLYDHMPDGVSDGETRSITLHTSVVNVLTEEDKAAITSKGWNLLVTT